MVTTKELDRDLKEKASLVKNLHQGLRDGRGSSLEGTNSVAQALVQQEVIKTVKKNFTFLY